MEIPDHLTCLLRNLCASQEAAVRTGRGAMDWFKTRRGIWQGCILSPCLLTYKQSTSWKCQARWITSWNQDCQEKYQQPQVCRWYHSNGRKWRGTESLLRRVKEESEKTGLKLNIRKLRSWHLVLPTKSWQIEGEKVETVTFYFLGLQNHCRWWLQPWN